MPRLTVTIDEDQQAFLEEQSGDGGPYESKSEAVRNCIQAYERVEELEQDVERLQNEKRTILAQREENQELARYVEDERTTQQRWREAGIVTKTKWKLLGMPESEA